MIIPINDLKPQNKILKKKFLTSIKNIFNHNKYILGPEVNILEKKLKSYCGTKYCITTSSGTDALLISLMALGIKSGDEVITTPFTYVSTAEVISRLGAKPIFVDIEEEGFNIDPKKIKQRISNKTKAIIAVSLFGMPANIKKIKELNPNIPIIEDGAQSFGSFHYNKKSCNLSEIGCTSFFPTKTLGAYGDGGAIFTNNYHLYKKIKSLRVHGQDKKYNYKLLGISARLDTIQAGILIHKLKLLDIEIKKREKIFYKYKTKLNSIKQVKIIETKSFNKSNFIIFSIIIKNNKRNKLKNYLKKKGIQTIIYYPKPLNSFKIFNNKKNLPTPNAKKTSDSILSLPMHPYLSQNKINYIIKHIHNFFN